MQEKSNPKGMPDSTLKKRDSKTNASSQSFSLSQTGKRATSKGAIPERKPGRQTERNGVTKPEIGCLLKGAILKERRSENYRGRKRPKEPLRKRESKGKPKAQRCAKVNRTKTDTGERRGNSKVSESLSVSENFFRVKGERKFADDTRSGKEMPHK